MFFCDNPPNIWIVVALPFRPTQERLESKMNKIKLGKASADQIEQHCLSEWNGTLVLHCPGSAFLFEDTHLNIMTDFWRRCRCSFGTSVSSGFSMENSTKYLTEDARTPWNSWRSRKSFLNFYSMGALFLNVSMVKVIAK